MFSMTGYGKGEYKQGGIELTVEIKTVNNRYLDVSVKSPKIFNAYEEAIRAQVREKLTRGHADLFINFVDKREKAKELYVDVAAAKGYYDAALKLKTLFPLLADDFTLTTLLKSPDVVRQEDVQGADEALLAALHSALGMALENLNVMRRKEGEKLAQDMLSRMDEVERLVGTSVHATDLRAGAAMVIAALMAEGETEIGGVEYILRGYERFDEKLRKLGACVQSVSSRSYARV